MQALGRTEREEASGASTVPSAVWQWLNPNNSSLTATSDTLPKRARSKKDDAAGADARASRKRKTAKYADETEGILSASNAAQDNEALSRRAGKGLNGKGKIKNEAPSEEAKLREDDNDEDFPQPSEPQPVICSCKKSRCLKLYCVCFSGQVFCSEKCICSYCANSSSFVNLRNKKRDAIIARKPNAFVSKYGTMQGPAADTNGATEVGAGAGASGSSSPRNAPVASSSSSASSPAGAQVAHLYGCHCKRSRCLYKYCECFYGRVRCTQACSCLDCQNFKTIAGGAINPKDMQVIMDIRTKEREEKKISLAKAAAEPGQNGLVKSRAYDRGTFDQFCLTNEAFVVAGYGREWR
jgi:hypothetical protein